MSDFAPLSSPAPMTPFADEPVTGGLLLRRARQAAGLHVEALAAALKVPVPKIEALEADRFDLLPDLVFVRALAASICRTLDVDPQPVLERLPRKAMPRLAHDRDRVNAPYRGPNDVAGPGWRDQLTRPPVLAVLALLLGAGALVLLPQSLLEDVARFSRDRMQPALPPVVALAPDNVAITPVQPTTVAEAVSAPSDPQGLPAAGPSLASYAAPDAAMTTALTPPPLAAGVASPMEPEAPKIAAAVLVPADSVATMAESAPTTGVLVFRTTGPSWVEVRDARGTVALRRMLAAGESADASGTPPLSVTVGKADVTQVQVRGKEFDLGPVARDNVARFQVK